PPVGGRVGQNLRIAGAAPTGLLDRQHVMPEPTQPLDHAEMEILVGVEAGPARSRPPAWTGGLVNLVARGGGGVSGPRRAFRRQPRNALQDLLIRQTELLPLDQARNRDPRPTDARLAAGDVGRFGDAVRHSVPLRQPGYHPTPTPSRQPEEEINDPAAAHVLV